MPLNYGAFQPQPRQRQRRGLGANGAAFNPASRQPTFNPGRPPSIAPGEGEAGHYPGSGGPWNSAPPPAPRSGPSTGINGGGIYGPLSGPVQKTEQKHEPWMDQPAAPEPWNPWGGAPPTAPRPGGPPNDFPLPPSVPGPGPGGSRPGAAPLLPGESSVGVLFGDEGRVDPLGDAPPSVGPQGGNTFPSQQFGPGAGGFSVGGGPTQPAAPRRRIPVTGSNGQ